MELTPLSLSGSLFRMASPGYTDPSSHESKMSGGLPNPMIQTDHSELHGVTQLNDNIYSARSIQDNVHIDFERNHY